MFKHSYCIYMSCTKFGKLIFSLLPRPTGRSARHAQWAPRGHLLPLGDGAQVRLLPGLRYGWLCPRQMLPLQRHGPVVRTRYHLQG
jgi:hypothetical protein